MTMLLLLLIGTCDVTTVTVSELLSDRFAACRTNTPPSAKEIAAQKSALKLSMTADPARIKSNESTRLVIRAESTVPVTVWISFAAHSEMMPMTVVDENGRAVLPPPNKPETRRSYNGSCAPDEAPQKNPQPAYVRVVLAAKGRIDEERWWNAEAYAWGKPDECGDVMFDRTGTLAPGVYKVSCSLPLAGGLVIEATTPVTVSK